jgi:hypothetical protein
MQVRDIAARCSLVEYGVWCPLSVHYQARLADDLDFS